MADLPIIIHRMIVHKVDHIDGTAPQYSDLEAPITDEIRQFFHRQIQESREHKNTRSGVFLPQEPGTISLATLCDGLTQSPAAFIEHSQAIAGHPFACIHRDRRIATSDLVVLTFSEPQDNEPWVAILKMDPQSGLVGEAQEIGGKTQIVLTLVPSVLTNTDLQKCAFVLPRGRRTDTRHVSVLDQQTPRFGSRQIAATFFVAKFLQCDIGGHARVRTRTFHLESITWVATKRGQWTDDAIDRFETRVRAALTEPRIDVETIARTMIAQDLEQIEYILHVRGKMQEKGFDDLVFAPDRSYLPEREYVYFEGDNGLKIRVRADEHGPGKTFFYEKDPATGRITLHINTSFLRQVSK